MKVVEVFGARGSSKDSKCRGWCNVVLDVGGAELVVTGCAIIDGANGEYVAFPSRKKKDGGYANILYFRSGNDDRDDFSSQVLAQLAELKNKPAEDDLPF